MAVEIQFLIERRTGPPKEPEEPSFTHHGPTGEFGGSGCPLLDTRPAYYVYWEVTTSPDSHGHSFAALRARSCRAGV
jgi:hypothetical protein